MPFGEPPTVMTSPCFYFRTRRGPDRRESWTECSWSAPEGRGGVALIQLRHLIYGIPRRQADLDLRDIAVLRGLKEGLAAG